MSSVGMARHPPSGTRSVVEAQFWFGDTRNVSCWMQAGDRARATGGCKRKPLALAAALYLGSGRDSRAPGNRGGRAKAMAHRQEDYAWYGNFSEVIYQSPRSRRAAPSASASVNGIRRPRCSSDRHNRRPSSASGALSIRHYGFFTTSIRGAEGGASFRTAELDRCLNHRLQALRMQRGEAPKQSLSYIGDTFKPSPMLLSAHR